MQIINNKIKNVNSLSNTLTELSCGLNSGIDQNRNKRS